jgi:hypothetical protein
MERLMERLTEACERAFARHETFHPRYGWLRKAVEAGQRATPTENPFLADDATVELGVGKNMVKSIRFWGHAAKLLDEVKNPERSRLVGSQASALGGLIFDTADGADPYMELAGTPWLMHWFLLRPTCSLPVWWLAFNRFGAVEFTDEDLVAFVVEEIGRAGWEQPNVSSIQKDVSCLLRTYASASTARETIDDRLDCPLRELGLIETSWESRHSFRFRLGAKPTLPDLVVAFACFDWLALQRRSARTVSLNRLATGIGAPGRIFRLSENDLLESLQRAVPALEGAELAMTAGAPQLTTDQPPSRMALAALGQYFEDCDRRVTVTGLDLGWAEEMRLTAEERREIEASSVDVLDRLGKTNKALRRKKARR